MVSRRRRSQVTSSPLLELSEQTHEKEEVVTGEVHELAGAGGSLEKAKAQKAIKNQTGAEGKA